MKNYANAEVTGLLREAINIGAHGEMWHHKHMLWAQAHGLQGHKRLNRYESCKDLAHYIRLQNYCVDMFGEVIEPDWDYAVPAPADIKDYLEAYINWENSAYTRLGTISNELETMGFPCEADIVRRGLPGKELEKVRRMLTEYALSGWDMTYILLADHKLHKKIKKKEK